MHLQSLLFSALSVSAVSLGWSALDKPSASNLIWDDKPAVVVYPQADKNPDGSFGKYKKPSAVWEAEGYPIGNGRVGAMIFSAPNRERFALNEISLWSGGPNFMERMVEGGKAVTSHFGPRIAYINVLRKMSVSCDCEGVNAAPVTLPDLGILASTDILAVDKASVDMVYALPEDVRRDMAERIESRSGLRQLSYMKEMGMGSDQYELITI